MTPRELAAAIRKGAAMRPQGKYNYFADGKSCAIGAALEAVGVPYQDTSGPLYSNQILGFFPNDKLQITDTLWTGVMDKNDSGMTREDIADWLDTLEPETKPADKQTFDAFMKAVMLPVDVEALKV